MIRVFSFDPADYREQYQAQGWVHIKNGITPEFLSIIQDYAERELEAHLLARHAIKGKKEQSLFEFPEGVDYPGELFDVVAATCGLNRPTMTLSERHIQAYEPNAEPEPFAHKDRYASQVSVGLSISVPAASTLVLFPYDERSVNPFNVSADFPGSLQPHEHPGVVAKTAREVELKDEDGDVVMFPGSSTWHFRRNSANSSNLYLKFNDFHCDPLGEDPRTADLRAATLAAIADGNGGLNGARPLRARRLDLVTQSHARNGEKVLQASVYGEKAFGITPDQQELLNAADGVRGIEDLSRVVGLDVDQTTSNVRLLAERGALDLL